MGCSRTPADRVRIHPTEPPILVTHHARDKLVKLLTGDDNTLAGGQLLLNSLLDPPPVPLCLAILPRTRCITNDLEDVVLL